MTDKRCVPEIRFNGFNNKWEEKKLGELADIVRGASPRPIEDPKWFDENSNVGWLRISDVSAQNGKIHYLSQRISKAGQEKTRVLTEPHLLLSIAASVGKPVVNYVETGVHDGFLIFRNPSFNHEFMFQWMKMFEGQWYKYGQPGSQVNLNSEIVKSQIVSISDGDEQAKIGNYFQQLDTLITHHQQKHDKLLNVKKAMLEKMFPKQGADVPEIRFKGFSGKWEKRELGEITLKIGSGKTPRGGNSTYVSEGVPLLRSQNIHNDSVYLSDVAYITPETHEEMKNSQVLMNDVLLNITGASIGRSAVYSFCSHANVNQHVCIIRPIKGYHAEFIQLNITSPKGQQKIDDNQAGGAREGLNFQHIGKFEFFFPSIEEQTKIGNYFKSLDSNINLHQTQLDKLKNIKKACLEKMFV